MHEGHAGRAEQLRTERAACAQSGLNTVCVVAPAFAGRGAERAKVLVAGDHGDGQVVAMGHLDAKVAVRLSPCLAVASRIRAAVREEARSLAGGKVDVQVEQAEAHRPVRTRRRHREP